MNDARPILDAETLLSHAPWLRSLAASLVGAEGADDVVQQTWLQTLSHPPRSASGLRGFLASTARHVAWRARERERNRTARERRVARDEALPSTADAVDQLQLQRLVVEAVLALPDAQRDVVLLRYFHGVPPARIASRLGIPASTVRSTLTRALAKLRLHLDQYWRGSSAWRLAILPLAAFDGGAGRASAGRWLRRALVATAAVGLGAWWLWSGATTPLGDSALTTDRFEAREDGRAGFATDVDRRPLAAAPRTDEPRRDLPTGGLAVDTAPTPEIAVQVQHANGAFAADVPVALELLAFSQWQTLAVATTAADGRATFRDALRDLAPRDRSRRLRVVPLIHARVTEPVELLAHALPAEPPVLTLPPLGAVVVVAPNAVAPLVALGAVDGERIPHGQRLGLLFDGTTAARLGLPRADGRARFRFPHVEVGLALHLDTFLAAPHRVAFDGPRFAGDDVVLALPDDAADPVTARLVDAAGRPFANERVWIEFGEVNPVEEHTQRRAGHTDARGVLRVSLPLTGDARVSHWMIVERAGDAGPHEPLAGNASAFHAWPAGDATRELGTLALREPPQLLAGSVTDASGRPLEGILVHAVRERRLPDGPQPLPHAMLLPYAARTDPHGAFELRGHTPPDTLVWARAENPFGLDAHSPPSPPGASGLLLTLTPASFLRGRVLVDPFVPIENLRVAAERDGHTTTADRLRADGSFALGPLTGAPTHLSFSLGPGTIARFELGERGRGEHAGAFDLRSRLLALDLVVQDEHGAPIVGLELSVRRADDRAALVSNGTKDDGAVRFLVPSAERAFVVTSRDTLPTPVAYRPQPQVVRLHRAALLDLTCTGALPPAAPDRWVARAVLLADETRRVEAVAPGASRDVGLDDRGHALVPLGLAGRWQVQLVWVRPRAFGRPLEVPIEHEPLWIDVRDGSPITRRLVVDDGALQAARRRFY